MSKLNNFKINCKLEEDTKQSRTDLYVQQIEEQKQYGYGYIPKMNTWTGTHKCPVDSERLKSETLFVCKGFKHVILSCSCGYKFAKNIRD